MSDRALRDSAQHQMVEYGTRMRCERDEAQATLRSLVNAYDACFDPDAGPGTADRLSEALAAARSHLEALDG